MFAVNADYFSRLFKEGTGKGFVEYLNARRVREACKLLVETSASVAEIVQLCGYGNTEYFYKIFKRTMGITPMMYRKTNGTGEGIKNERSYF